MGYRFIALLNDRDPIRVEAALRDLDLRIAYASPTLKLFTSKDTPLAFLPDDTIVIGDLFLRDGTPFDRGRALPAMTSNEQTLRYILEHYWGEYVLLQPSSKDRMTNFMRDPSGGMPCIFMLVDGAGFVTSDISLASQLGLYDRRVDWNSIAYFLAYPHLKSLRTGLEQIQELLPGCTLSWNGGTGTVRVEWSPWDLVSREHRHHDPQQAASDVRYAVETSVEALASREHSIMLELSGGLDSSIVGSCLRKSSARVHCCTLLTPVPGADEREYAALVAENLGGALRADPLRFEDARIDFPPTADSVAPRCWALQHATDEVKQSVGNLLGVTSYFNGGGGDAVFCYLSTAAPSADAFLECGAWAAASAVKDLARLHHCTIWKAAKLTAKKLLRSSGTPYKPDMSFIVPDAPGLGPPDHPWLTFPNDALPGDCERISDITGTQVFRDDVARGRKHHLRMPLLSQPVIEACLRTPSWMWISGGRNRAVARAAFAELLPSAVLNRRSKGTFMNYVGALFRRNQVQIRDFLMSGELHAHGLLDTTSLQEFFARSLSPREDSYTRIFELCQVENWVRHQSMSTSDLRAGTNRPVPAAFINRQRPY